MTNHYLSRQAGAAKNSHGKASEKRVVGKLGGRLTPASGAMRGGKGDARGTVAGRKQLVESKSTVNLTLGVDIGWLVKLTEEARSAGADPILTMSFVTPDGKARKNGDWVAMPLADYQELMERLSHGTNVDV